MQLLIYKENSTNCYFFIYLLGWETLVNYCDTEYSLLDDFVENEPICFYKSGVTKVHAPNVDVKYIKRLKIVKASVEKALLGDTIFIEYWNIPLTQH